MSYDILYKFLINIFMADTALLSIREHFLAYIDISIPFTTIGKVDLILWQCVIAACKLIALNTIFQLVRVLLVLDILFARSTLDRFPRLRFRARFGCGAFINPSKSFIKSF